MSELRATELLDDLCEDMQQYTWAPEALPGADAAGAGAADDTPPEPSGKPPSMAEVTDKVLAGTQLRWRWQRTSEVDGTAPPSMRAPKAEQKQRRKELQAFCYSLLERTEEKLTAYLSEDKPHHEGPTRLLGFVACITQTSVPGLHLHLRSRWLLRARGGCCAWGQVADSCGAAEARIVTCECKGRCAGVDDFICAQLMPYCPLEAQTAPHGAAGVDAAKDEL